MASIQLISTLAGTGNITVSNVANTVTSATSFAGAIRFQTAVNTFVGSVLLQRGATVFNNAGNFGGAGNTITLGQSGQGSVTLMSTAGVDSCQSDRGRLRHRRHFGFRFR